MLVWWLGSFPSIVLDALSRNQSAEGRVCCEIRKSKNYQRLQPGNLISWQQKCLGLIIDQGKEGELAIVWLDDWSTSPVTKYLSNNALIKIVG